MARKQNTRSEAGLPMPNEPHEHDGYRQYIVGIERRRSTIGAVVVMARSTDDAQEWADAHVPELNDDEVLWDDDIAEDVAEKRVVEVRESARY